MTEIEAGNAMIYGTRVQAGLPGTDDHDTGRVVAIDSNGMALVAWDSGVRTPCPLADLTEAE